MKGFIQRVKILWGDKFNPEKVRTVRNLIMLNLIIGLC